MTHSLQLLRSGIQVADYISAEKLLEKQGKLLSPKLITA